MRTAPKVRDKGPLARWAFVMTTCNPPPGKVDLVSKVLVLIRACVFPMTLTSGAVAGLLAVGHPDLHLGWLGLAVLGLLLAHAANNLMNDLFDLSTAVDTADYPRALYAPHPVLSGMISKRGLATWALLVNLLSLGVLLTLTAVRGWPVLAFALAGAFVSVGYTAPPIRLKKRGLGEPGVLVVWGPLMVGGTFYAATGTVTWEVLLASVPYALLATAVLMGKHIDKLPWDADRDVGTLPALLGEARARAVTRWMMASAYLLLPPLVAIAALPVASLLALGALPRLRKAWKAFARPRPGSPPKGYPVWPLWYAPVAFVHTRYAGGLFVVGLALGSVLPGRL